MVGTKQSNFFDQFDNQNVNFYELAFLLLPFVREKKTYTEGEKTICKLHVTFHNGENPTLAACAARRFFLYTIASRAI